MYAAKLISGSCNTLANAHFFFRLGEEVRKIRTFEEIRKLQLQKFKKKQLSDDLYKLPSIL